MFFDISPGNHDTSQNITSQYQSLCQTDKLGVSDFVASEGRNSPEQGFQAVTACQKAIILSHHRKFQPRTCGTFRFLTRRAFRSVS